MVDNSNIHDVIRILKMHVYRWDVPVVTLISRRTRDPFRVLIATIISLRTKDNVTAAVSERLFRVADTPHRVMLLPEEEISHLIYPAGFYRRKAENIKRICTILVEKYNGRVPDTIDELLKLPGVGRKTANLVLTRGYGKPGICVDTHVHRISNRWGYVSTRTPDETEMVLRSKLPLEYWIEYNDLLVALGQKVCHPVSPFCSRCPVNMYCARICVRRSR